MVNPAVVVASISWQSLAPAERAAAFLAATASEGPPYRLPKENIAFEPALQLSLVDSEGRMREEVFEGLQWALS